MPKDDIKSTLDTKDDIGETTLVEASQRGHDKIVSMILNVLILAMKAANWDFDYRQYGDYQTKDFVTFSVDIEDKYGETALRKASQNGHEKTVSIILNAVLKDCIENTVNIESYNGFSALRWQQKEIMTR